MTDSKAIDPFFLDEEIEHLCEDITADIPAVTVYTAVPVAYRIYNWVLDNIRYGKEGLELLGVGYRTAREKYLQGEGICGEMTFLATAMCRFLGVEAHFVAAAPDSNNPFDHAIMGVEEGNRIRLFDPACQLYEGYYGKLQVWDDRQVVFCFNVWRGTPKNELPPQMPYLSANAMRLTKKLRCNLTDQLVRSYIHFSFSEQEKKRNRPDGTHAGYRADGWKRTRENR